jgi:catechol 2,3-dioxygenase-like lactoylglutathione lyase family enzyme
MHPAVVGVRGGTVVHVGRLDHFTVRCRPQDLDGLRDFYVGVLGLLDGARPDFDFPGHWLYGEGRPIVHLAATLDTRPARETGSLDHIAFSGRGLDETVRLLKDRKIVFEQRPVPGFPLHQVFFSDPQGLRIELTFEVR